MPEVQSPWVSYNLDLSNIPIFKIEPHCSYCAKKVEDEDDLRQVGRYNICEDCAEVYITVCFNCEQESLTTFCSRTPSNTIYCNDCYSEHVTECTECATLLWIRDATEIEEDGDGNLYCFSCSDRLRNEYRNQLSETFEINKSKRLVGFEIEYFGPRRPSALRELGRLHSDGSIEWEEDEEDRDCIGQEFSSHPTNGDRLFEVIDQTFTAIRRVNGQVNSSCGLHVHLDMGKTTQLQRENIQDWWVQFEPIFFSLVDYNRAENQYTKPVQNPEYKLPRADDDWQYDRYRALNIAAYSKHGTYEVRLHHATTKTERVKEWVNLLLSFFDTFQDIKFTKELDKKLNRASSRKKLIYFLNKLNMPLKTRKKFIARMHHYSGPTKRNRVLNLRKEMSLV